MNDAGQAIVALGVCATIAVSVSAIARAYVRGAEVRRRLDADAVPDVDDRMSRIEHAVDAIALEVERMSEGQRFTTRLLAERLGDASPRLDANPARRTPPNGTNGMGGRDAR